MVFFLGFVDRFVALDDPFVDCDRFVPIDLEPFGAEILEPFVAVALDRFLATMAPFGADILVPVDDLFVLSF